MWEYYDGEFFECSQLAAAYAWLQGCPVYMDGVLTVPPQEDVARMREFLSMESAIYSGRAA